MQDAVLGWGPASGNRDAVWYGLLVFWPTASLCARRVISNARPPLHRRRWHFPARLGVCHPDPLANDISTRLAGFLIPTHPRLWHSQMPPIRQAWICVARGRLAIYGSTLGQPELRILTHGHHGTCHPGRFEKIEHLTKGQRSA
jgi:hypothetical protein